MKLSPSLIEQAPIYINPSKEVTLQLRNLHLTVIEDFPTIYKFDCLDLSHNELLEIEFSSKLSTLIINNNPDLYHISTEGLGNLESLCIINGNIKFVELKTWKLQNLHTLVLIDNPISAIQNYRLLVIKQFPKLRVLDFIKVKQSERQQAEKLEDNGDVSISPDMKLKLIEQLQNTQDLDEIERIERLLSN